MSQTAIFGGGCFWCTEAVFQRLKGVTSVVSGYAGGQNANPTYREICTGTTGHAEVIEVKFNPDEISFTELLDVFWQAHDPTTLNRQGADVGTQYRSVIMTLDETQAAEAQASKDAAQTKFSDPIVTEIVPAPTFYPAEGYHQDYYNQNSSQGYCRVVIHPKLQKLGML